MTDISESYISPDLAKIEDNEIVIRIPFNALPNAFLHAWDEEYGFDNHTFIITDINIAAQNFINYINEENEVGETTIHRTLDEAVINMTEQGEEGISDGTE